MSISITNTNKKGNQMGNSELELLTGKLGPCSITIYKDRDKISEEFIASIDVKLPITNSFNTHKEAEQWATMIAYELKNILPEEKDE